MLHLNVLAILTDRFLWSLCPHIHDCTALGLDLGLDFNLDISPMKYQHEDKTYFAHNVLQVSCKVKEYFKYT